MTYAPVEPELRWLGSRKFWLAAASILLVSLAGLGVQTLRVTTRRASPAEAFVYGQSELTPGLPAEFRVFVRDAADVRPIPEAEVRAFLVSTAGKRIALGTGKTDANGMAQASAKLPKDLAEGDYKLVVKVASTAGTANVERPLTVKRSFRTMITTDKPLYQPGQVIHIRSLSLATADLRPAAGQDAVIEVQDPKGNKVFKKRLKTSDYGIVSADFQLADQVNTGDYTISSTIGDTTSERSVTVRRYVLPKFRINLTTDRGYYRPGQKLVADLHAEYTFGKPVAKAKVQVTADEFIEKFRTFATADGETDGEGRFHFEIPLKKSFVGQDLKKGDAIVKLEAKVTDTAGHVLSKAMDLTVTQRPIRIEVFPESGELVQNVENVLYIVTAYPDGRPAKTQLAIGASQELIETSDVGIAKVKITPRKQELKLTVAAEDAQGLKSQVTRALRVGERSDAFILRTDKAVYRTGETANVEVISAAPKARVFMDVVKDRRTMLMKAIDVANGRGALPLDLPADVFGTLELHAYRIMADGNIVRDTKVIHVNRADGLRIKAELDKETYRPGETALLKFIVQRPNGDPAQAALSLMGVDEAVYALHDLRPGLEQIYFTLQEEILKPRYEIHAHAPITPKRTIERSPDGDPELEEASVVLFSAASGSTTPECSPGRTVSQQRRIVRRDKRIYFGNLVTALVLSPFFVFLLLVLPVGVYAIVRLFNRNPIGEAGAPDLAEFGGATASLNLRWLMGMYGPVLSGLVLGAFGSAPGLGLAGVFVTYLGMLLLLIAAVQRIRRCRATQAVPLLRKLVCCVPWAYAAAWLAIVVVLLDNRIRSHIWDGEAVLVVLPDIGIVSLLLVGFLSVARDCSLRPLSAWRWLGLMVGRPVIASVPGLLIVVLAFLGPSVRNLFSHSTAKLSGDAWDERRDMAKTFTVDEDALGMAGPRRQAATVQTAAGVIDHLGQAPKLKAPTRIRRYFPETLFWRPELITDAAGRAELQLPLADSITTWRVGMSAVSARGELGAATKGLRCFQDFFVDIDFPVALTQNDLVSVPIAVFNYLDKPQTVRLEAQSVAWCEMLDGTTRQLRIGAQEVTSVSFRLRALKPGRHALTVKAFGSEMADAVERQVRVVPDGQEMVTTINGRLSENLANGIVIPDQALDGANDLVVKIYPGAFSQVMEGMDNIFQMPYGCFEQTSSTTYPNVLVLDYLRRTKQAKPDVEMKALNYINLGYQRLLSYEVEGGGFDWFGRPPAHNVLTAYGLMEFHDMAKVYEIDEAVIERTRTWLYQQQKGDGTWQPSAGGIAEGAINQFRDAALRSTAYIAWGIAETGDRDSRLNNALGYLQSKSSGEDDAYTLALCANAFIAADRTGDAKGILTRLEGMKIEDGEVVHWTSKSQGVTYSRGNALDIETTALVAYAMLKSNQHLSVAHKALAWVVEQKDSRGTWHSTQATVHAMRALLAGTGPGGGVEEDVHVTITANGKVAKELTITPDTSDVFRLIDLRPFVRTGRNVVALEASGKGNLAYQIVATHYLPWEKGPVHKGTVPEPLSIDVQYDATQVNKNDLLTCNVSVRYNRPGTAQMTIVDLGIPPGFEVQTDALQALKAQGVIERYSLTGRQIILYIREIRVGTPLQFSYKLRAKFPVKAKTPVSRAYQYYEPEVRAEAKPVVLTIL